ncbi:hypothetical protein [Nocardioides sp. YIM 152315]|uniref:hypothetical protein n=1 Tax=Nocardioides sp. YIM 152315 TaxID=3031760 RepID=UPI0023DB0156|nr:hypothetical protein [Nocardioides sp. YIM 152315]MDF1603367.1 hypothetical protein [Nocardioides sp. YIM 152315]
MSRPAHIAPLDAALDEHMSALVEAERRQVEVHEKHAEFLRLHAESMAEVKAAQEARSNAYYGAKSCEGAIRKLGYCVLGTVGSEASRLDGHPGDFRNPVTPPAQTGGGDDA